MIRIQDHYLHLPNISFNFDNSRDIKLLYALRVLRDLVNKSTLFFLPIFLFIFGQEAPILARLGISDFQKGMLAVSVYLFSQGLLGSIFAIPAGQLISKIGHQRAIYISYFLRLLAFTALYYVRVFPWAIFVAMIFEGIQTPLFWNSYHTILSQSAKKRHMGQDLGVLQFLLQIAAVIAPALGGILAMTFGMEILFLFGLIGTLLGVIVAMMMRLEEVKDKVSLIEFKKWWREPRFRRLSVSFAGRYLNDIALFIWPLYVFLIIGSIDRVGYLYTFSLFLAMVLSFFIGTYIDHHSDNKPFKLSGGFLTILWIIRTRIFSVWSIAFVDTLEKLVGNFHWLFYDSVVIGRGKGSQALSYFAYRELIIGIMAAVFWLIFGSLFLIFENSWMIVFNVAAVGVMLSLFARQKGTQNGR